MEQLFHSFNCSFCSVEMNETTVILNTKFSLPHPGIKNKAYDDENLIEI